ncbi:MAG: glucoamylase family protein [Azospirillaceae bacterium]|nr:glucoamylase family protein [Azospirillaceae bacterium]
MTVLPRHLFRRVSSTPPWNSHDPIRGELFSVERLEDHARSLAAAQTIEAKPTKGRLLAGRLADNGVALLAAYRTLVKTIDDGRPMTPAAEWLVDNYHLVERHIREIRSDLPSGYYRQLPKLNTGPFAGYPRVFGMAWAFVAHTDSGFDVEMLRRYIGAYQEVQPLTIGELWAVAITLRIVLVENLRRLVERILWDRTARQQADDLADRLLGVGGHVAEPISAVLGDQEHTALHETFAVQLVHRLRDQDPRITPALTWLDQRLALQDMTADAIVRDVHRSQGASNVTVRNIITSLRKISDVDWTLLFESISLIDRDLAAGTVFREMDFATRNLYRSAIEELARGSNRAEGDITDSALLAARQAAVSPENERSADPGYHLIGGGRRALELAVGFRRPWYQGLEPLIGSFGITSYTAAIAIVTAALLALPLLFLAGAGLGATGLGLLATLGAIPAIDAGVALVNRAVAFCIRARPLPALELREGIPAHLRTLVAVPTLLTTPEAIAEQIERLEIHYLASTTGELHFALLSDWTDAATEHAEHDEALLAAAADGIARLNQRHRVANPEPGGNTDRFLLLHRRRIWNQSEGRWIGWERKRGKLHELNRLLRGASDTSFLAIAGTPPGVPPDVRYVVTLDSDTRLPRDTVRRLIGKMAHPLNRARFDAGAGRVVEGYGVLQPRVTPSQPIGQEGSLFQRTFSNPGGIDPYAAAASDIYQDLFGEGSYAGKGIYDVDAFEASLAGRVPDSTLLSHDLFEGVFARAGLASDVEVVEEFPARYDVDTLRHHRWVRGDWQLLPWIFGCAPIPAGAGRTFGVIPAIGRCKMLDNLRRSLSAPLSILALFAGWMLPFPAALIWTIFILATILVPILIPVIKAIPPLHPGVTVASQLRGRGDDIGRAATQSALRLILLAHQAWLMGDAIVRTLWRLGVTRRHLLEWTTAAQTGKSRRLDLAGFYRRMSGALVIAVAAMTVVWLSRQPPFHGGAWPLAVPLAVLWLLSPAVARWASRSPAASWQLQMSSADADALRLTARRTWRFFESMVTATDNWLPPDNFQEDPTPTVAHRTSPTNIGLYLLSVVCARDFGWIGISDTVERLEATLATMGGLERFHGHFFNWYDTTDRRPLDPKYVSSVDSGNLAGHLIALANACREWQSCPPTAASCRAGIADAIDLTRQEAAGLRDGRLTQTVTWHQLDDALADLAATVRQPVPASGDPAQELAAFAVRAEAVTDIAQALEIERNDGSGADMLFWIREGMDAIATHRRDLQPGLADALRPRLALLEATARSMALAMDFRFLLDRDRNLLSIGYSMAEGTLDANCYDLLASEARLASFIAIAKGDVPARHWFRLGRAVTPIGSGAALISWSGSMFEYLMPSLVMRAPADSLIEQTNRLIVQRQIDYATSLHLPWGISESAFNARDLELTYQYSNFGVPGLGLKRALGQNLVVAPYATALAAMIDPRAAVANLARLELIAARGRYGFYEALDFTATRVPPHSDVAIVKTFMAHHQGMTIVAIADTLLDGRMRARFHAEPIVQATELLLQERIPRDIAVTRPWATDATSAAGTRDDAPLGGRSFGSAHQATPATHLLSNGRFTTMLTSAGSGYSRWGDIAVTRWREDATCDHDGSYIFLRDIRSNEVWSAGFQPCAVEPDAYEVTFNEDRAAFTRRDGTLTTTLDVLVSDESDAEVRRLTITNAGGRTRNLEVTSYAELVLAPQAADVAHPAFSKLFVETEYLADVGAILATRRRRAPGEPEIWAAHLAVVEGDGGTDAAGNVGLSDVWGGATIETDRARFLGRGHGVRAPIAVIDGRALSNTVGTVLDPIFALRRRVRIAPGATVRIAFWTIVASTREALLDGVDKHRDPTAFARAATLAWTQAQVQLLHLGITAGEAALFQSLAGHVIYVAPTLRPASDTIRRGAGPQSGLWRQGLSGDLPIVLLRIADVENLDIAHQLLRAHEYWRMKQLSVDLVILNERQSSYVQDLQVAIESLVRASHSRHQAEATGGYGRVFVLRADLIEIEARNLLGAVARVVLVARHGSLLDQLERIVDEDIPPRPHGKRRFAGNKPSAPPTVPDLEFFNGLGGFANNGRDYVTILGPGQSTPAPWLNVIANPVFGFQVATEGTGYSWAVNSRENQLTPWSNDPVTDYSGEAFYLHDDDTGDLWSPTALPIRDPAATYQARHGHGYSRFTFSAHGIASDLRQYVPVDDPLKISRLVLRNHSGRVRRLSVTAYVEWVLGPSRSASLPFITTEIDPGSGAMFAGNPWGTAFGTRIAFIVMREPQTDWTGDRREFIGRNGTLADPAALGRVGPLSRAVGAGLDPCGVMRSSIELAPNASGEIVFFLGDAANAEQARTLIARYRAADLDAIEAGIDRYWDEILGSIQVKTPDRSMDIMLNGWLLYQTLVCRIWARSAFYQASGAYGFRDQLQDGMALAAVQPQITRVHLLRAAGRQFVEGDVQHWWLPHSGQGVRTRISDDRVWLAAAIAQYVDASGDVPVLDEMIPFLDGERLTPEQHDSFFQPMISDETASLFEHGARGLDASLAVGSHGLPLIGTGDWNDGMNRVGAEGRGESVWLAWLLYATLTAFAVLADRRHETGRATIWRDHAAALQRALEAEAWDGDWYRRGWFDNGLPLGSASNEECRIDSIAQSWAVISGAAEPARAARAMAAVERELIDDKNKLALLFAPPFDKAALDPGYIEGYPPGVRENGGQYTHAALWSAIAFAALGEGNKAEGLFSLLNPINHARSRTAVLRYKVEPYVVAADVYARPPHVGRGGWTWYTGSAGWMQRLGIESILGLRICGQAVHLDPCIPRNWPGFTMTLRHRSAHYAIIVENPTGRGKGVLLAELDGATITARPVQWPLRDDGLAHHVRVTLG